MVLALEINVDTSGDPDQVADAFSPPPKLSSLECSVVIYCFIAVVFLVGCFNDDGHLVSLFVM